MLNTSFFMINKQNKKVLADETPCIQGILMDIVENIQYVILTDYIVKFNAKTELNTHLI